MTLIDMAPQGRWTRPSFLTPPPMSKQWNEQKSEAQRENGIVSSRLTETQINGALQMN